MQKYMGLVRGIYKGSFLYAISQGLKKHLFVTGGYSSRKNAEMDGGRYATRSLPVNR
jgi:hypothetical protein